MDVVAQYSPPTAKKTLAVNLASHHANERKQRRRDSMPSMAATLASDGKMNAKAQGKWERRKADSEKRAVEQDEDEGPASTTFNRSVQISLMEPVGSMSLSPANRDVVLAARKGLFIIDLENPYDQPRFLPHLTTWVPADVQWNPHPARSNWVASTSNNKLLVWNLDRPAAPRIEPIFTMASATGSSPSLASGGLGVASPSTFSGTLPLPHHSRSDLPASTSRLSSISHVLHAHTRAITDINWSPFHPDVLASCGIDTWTWAWDLRDPSKPRQGYSSWNAAMTQVKWNRATQHRLATSCDNKVLIWDDRKGALPLATIEAHENKIYGVDWSRDTSLGMSRLVTCSLDGMVKWWDLDSPAAQQAISQRQLVTEPETTIRTDTPVWRARHLPFGQGVMTLPQRGDTSLSMWSKEHVDEPVHRFNGHRDIVKEYLFRTQGGTDLTQDDRRFQLITWGKDQTLRLWPITDDMMKAVSHTRGQPIRVRQTRIGAPNISYRNPPISPIDDVIDAGTPVQAITRSPASSAHITPGTSAGMVPPSGATLSLLNGSGKAGSLSNSSARLTSPPASFSPVDGRVISPSSLGRQDIHPLNERQVRKALSVTQLAVRESIRRKVGDGQTSMQARVRDGGMRMGSAGRHSTDSRAGNPSWTGSHETSIRARKGTRAPLSTGRVMSRQQASYNFMTRGTMAQGGQSRTDGAAQKGNASRVNAIGWIAGVRMGRETRTSSTVAAPQATGRSHSADHESKTEREDTATPVKDAAQVLSEEIMSVSKSVGSATFEKIDVSSRSCTATCYGPWTGKGVPCFLRITFHFPSTYPAKAPRFELEHNASVALKTRAFLLRNISIILDTCSRRSQPEPSMEACLMFLSGQTVHRLSEEAIKAGDQPFWLPGDEEHDEDDDEEGEEERMLSVLKMPPRHCGATFAANGLLVTFKPAQALQTTATPSARQGATSTAGAQSESMQADTLSGRSRFLESYSALAGAMTSLARLAKEGMSVQDLDVVQLMGDEAFFQKRLRQSGHSQSHQLHGHQAGPASTANAARLSSKPGSTSASKPRGDPSLLDGRAAALALQARLGLQVDSRTRTHSQSGRARSASPMSARGGRSAMESGYASPLMRGGGILDDVSHFTTAARSHVKIWDVSSVLLASVGQRPGSATRPFAPPLVRRRSASTPASPALTPRTEGTFTLNLPLSVPESIDGVGRAGVSDSPAASQRRHRDLRNAIDDEYEFDAANMGFRVQESDSDDDNDQHSDDEPDAGRLLYETQQAAIHPVAEGTLDTLIWTIPFAFLYLMMDIMIQQQYAMHPGVWDEVKRMANALPMLTVFIYYTAVRADRFNRVVLQLALFFIGTATGCAFLYTYTKSNQAVVARRTPPLGTLWIYGVARMELTLAVVSLAVVYGFVTYHHLPLFT